MRSPKGREVRDDTRYQLLCLLQAEVVREWVGLRPGRSTVRLETELRPVAGRPQPLKIVHNYGHGGVYAGCPVLCSCTVLTGCHLQALASRCTGAVLQRSCAWCSSSCSGRLPGRGFDAEAATFGCQPSGSCWRAAELRTKDLEALVAAGVLAYQASC